MEELIKLVSQKANITDQVSRVAVDTVLNYIKQRLPQPLASQVDRVVQTGQRLNTQDIAGEVGGMFGQSKKS